MILEKPRKNSSETLVIDISLRELRMGFEQTHKIKTKFSGVPTIAYSASVFKHEVVACFKAGFDDFIAKPSLLEDFTGVLINFLGR